MATKLELVLREIEDLTPDEQQQVREALDRLPDGSPKPTPLQQRLLEASVIQKIADPRKRAEHFRNFKPIKLEGELVSEQIIRERR